MFYKLDIGLKGPININKKQAINKAKIMLLRQEIKHPLISI